MPIDHTQIAALSPTARSKLTNHRELLPGLDGRSAGARRFRDLIGQIVADQGGLDRLSESRIQLIKRFSAACVIAEQLESKLAAGEEIDLHQHALLVSSLVRLSTRLGIDRIPREVRPSLQEYLMEARA